MATLSVWLLYPIDFYLINLKLGPRKRLVYVMELVYVMATLCDTLLYYFSSLVIYPNSANRPNSSRANYFKVEGPGARTIRSENRTRKTMFSKME